MPDGTPRFTGTPMFGGEPVGGGPRFNGVPMFAGDPVKAEEPQGSSDDSAGAPPAAPAASERAPAATAPVAAPVVPPPAAAEEPAYDPMTGIQIGSSPNGYEGGGALGRIGRAAADAAQAGFGDQPLASKTTAEMGGLVNQTPEESQQPILGTLRTANDVLLRGSSQAADLAMRAPMGAVTGLVGGFTKALEEAGILSPTHAGQLERDINTEIIRRGGDAGAVHGHGDTAIPSEAASRVEPPPIDGSVSGESPQTAPAASAAEAAAPQAPAVADAGNPISPAAAGPEVGIPTSAAEPVIPPAPQPETPGMTRQREAADLTAWMNGKRPPAEPLYQPEPDTLVSVTLPDGTTARGTFVKRDGDAATISFFDEEGNAPAIRGQTITGNARSLSFAPMELDEREQQHVAANEAATSPLNDKPAPTPAQIGAGNYEKGHVTVQGLDISIENPEGSVRQSTERDADGNPVWQNTSPAHYGYIKSTEGADGEHVDTYVGPNPKATKVYLVDQIDPATGKFDEHKALIGFNDEAHALATYAQGFSDGSGPSRIGAISTMPMPRFKRWLKDGDTTQPFKFKEAAEQSAPAQATSPVTEPAPPGRVESAAPAPIFKGEPVEPQLNAPGSAVNLHPATPQVEKLLATTDLRPKVADVAKAGKMTVEDAKRTLAYLAGKGGLIKQTGVNTYRKMPRRTTPMDLVEYLASKGGIRDAGGELKARDLDKKFVPGVGKLVRSGGRSLDDAALVAHEAGYFPELGPLAHGNRATINHLLDAIDRNTTGPRIFAESDRNAVAARGEAAILADERRDMEHVAETLGIEHTPAMTREDLGNRIREAEHAELLNKPDHAIGQPDIDDLADERDRLDEAIEQEARLADNSLPETPHHDDDIPFDDRSATGEARGAARPADEGQGGESAAAGYASDGVDQGQREAAAGPGAAPAELDRQARFDAQRTAPETEKTSQGEQLTLGASTGRISDAERAQRGADAGLKPKVPQKRADDGLFDVQGRGQEDLVDRAKKPRMTQVAPSDKPFFSALTREVEAIRQPRAPAAQWRGIIDKLKGKGVKEEEIAWSGVRDWLDEQKGSVSKEAILDHLRENEVQIQEVTKGPDAPETGGWTHIPARTTKFDEYTVPGGTNYRETLLTLPPKHPELPAGYTVERHQGGWSVLGPEGEVANAEDRGRAIKVANERLGNAAADYRSSHFDEPNILAHIRMNDRLGSKGEKILHLEEIQSDWHQKGRREGYQQPEEKLKAEFEAAKQRQRATRTDDPAYDGLAAETNAAERRLYMNHGVPDAPFKTSWHELALKRALRYASENGYDRLTWTKGETQAARYDLSKQVDHILYQKNADGTYRLSAQARGRGHLLGDSIPAEKLEDHVGKDVAKRIVDGVGDDRNIGANNEPRDVWKRLSGLDLKVGGEGMKGFYDKILPNAANKIGKPFGAKVENGEIGVPEASRDYIGPTPSSADIAKVDEAVRARSNDQRFVSPITGERQIFQINRVTNSQALDNVLARMRENGGDFHDAMVRHGQGDLADIFGGRFQDKQTARGAPVHAMDITPAMRQQAVEKGFPMFRAGEPTPGLIKNREAIRQQVADEIQRLAPGTVSSILDRHSVAYDAPDGTRHNIELNGSYLDGVINVALSSDHPLQTARHEVIHALRDLGLIRPSEWGALSRASREYWMPRYNIEARYGHYDTTHPNPIEARIEEGVAEGFADFNPKDVRGWIDRNGGNLPPAVVTAAKRVWNFFQKVRAMLAGRGFHSLDDAFAVRDTFERIQSGEIGQRPWQRDPFAEANAIAAEERETGRTMTQVAEPPPERAEYPAGVDHAGPGRSLLDGASRFVRGIAEDLQMKVAPMATGSDSAKVIAKRFANDMRVSQYRWTRADDHLEHSFTPAQRERMWNAGDEQSVLEQTGADTAGKGLDLLSPAERAAVDQLHALGEPLWERAKAVGIVKGEGLPSYMPRMFVDVADDGSIGRLTGAGKSSRSGATSGGRGIDTMGRNLSTAGPKGREHLTAAESEAGAKGISTGASIVRDVRALPLAYGRLERAIAGKELINSIKELGTWTGRETVSDGAREGFFTLDHPSFQTYEPKMRDRSEPGPLGGMREPVLDDQGNPIFVKRPIYVSKEFEGPLRAVLTKESGAIYNAMMALKGKTMSVIMYSPLIHNEVEWGRAFGAMPLEMLKVGKAEMSLPGGMKLPVPVPKIYRDGYRLKQDPVQMEEAIRGGLVPIGHRGFNQDITGIAEAPNLKPGRSLTSKIVAFPFGMVSEAAGNAVKRGFDRAGNVWHNTLLWDRVGDLQMGLYDRVLASGLKKGLPRDQAVIVAAHEANRFAGALPNESMSGNARKVANFVLFSRSFTLGNLGVMKDAINGLPRDLQAQLRASGADGKAQQAAGELARTFARRKAVGAIIKDVALAHLGVALVQNAVNLYRSGGDWDKEKQGYADRWHRLVDQAGQSLWNVANPFADMNALSPTGENEQGKENRVDVGPNSKGTEIYARLPTGKIGEEFEGYLTEPLEMLRRKVGTVMRPLLEIYKNDQGFGRQVYNPKDPLIEQVAETVWHVLAAQAPIDAIKGVRDIVTGDGDKATNIAKAAGPLAGITVSQGAPGGKAVGELYAAETEHWNQVRDAMPDINKMIQRNDLTGALQKMTALGLNHGQIRATIAHALDPASRLSKGKLRDAELYMTPAQRDRMSRMIAAGAAAP